VYRFCVRQGLQDADAADVTQEVLDQVARSMPTLEYQPERGRFRDWLGTVTRHKLARFHHRKNRAEAAVGGDEAEQILKQMPAPAADADWTANFHARVLHVALERIRPNFEPATWQAFERVWLENRPAPETARELNLPVATVYVAKSRVLKHLREEILALADDLPQFVPLG
jgi:RNA polymerase sigma-70 factor (ECF subfamily)